MGIGVLADVHGNITALQAVLADGRARGVERWLCLGDLAFKGPAPEECLAVVRALGDDVALMGNTEEWLPVGPPDHGNDPAGRVAIRTWWDWTIGRLSEASLSWLRGLPKTHDVRVGRDRLLCVHATARGLEDTLLPWAPPAEVAEALDTAHYNLVACAHIHTPYLRVIAGTTVVNTGSTGRPIDSDPRASYLILRPDSESTVVEFRRIPYDVAEITSLAYQVGFPAAEQYESALRQGHRF